MNGEVNGAMDEQVHSTVSEMQNKNDVVTDSCSEENSINSTMDSNILNSESNRELMAESGSEQMDVGTNGVNDNETQETRRSESPATAHPTINEASNTSFADNHCANSNDSESSDAHSDTSELDNVTYDAGQGARSDTMDHDDVMNQDASQCETNNEDATSDTDTPKYRQTVTTDGENAMNDESSHTGFDLADMESSQGSQSDTIDHEKGTSDTLGTVQNDIKNSFLGHFDNKNTKNNEIAEHELDSEEDFSDECSAVQPRAEDTVSINSDSEGEEYDEVARAHSQNGTNHKSPSPEVQEIISDNTDNEVSIISDDKSTNNIANQVQLRRSSRAIKRKRYTDEMENGNSELDIDEMQIEHSSKRKSKPIVINDTKALVEMAVKHIKANQNNNQKKEPTVVIIDTHSGSSEKSSAPQKNTGMPSNASLNAQNLYKSIVARGTTVTPIKCTPSPAEPKPSTSASQPSILPSLTDDMYVVEAPSFIVPYVYEKPSVKAFREFVDKLGKELEDKKAKEEKEKEEKLKKEKEKLEREKQERKERGEQVEDSEEEEARSSPEKGANTSAKTNDTSMELTNDERKKKKKKGNRHPDEDDMSWHGDTSSDSEDENISDEDKTVIIKDKVDDVIDGIKDVTQLTADKVCVTKTDNYFDCSLGKFFINIGLSLVQEYVQSDLLKQQNRKLNREKKTGQDTKNTETSIASLMKNIEFSKENNAPYSFPQQKCEFCSFKAESKLVMEHHLETPHMKNNVYKCNYCTFEIRSPHDILFHMEAEHNIRGKLERAPAYHQCANCPFEDNGKGKLARHLIPCAKKFKPDLNLSPPLEWEPPAKIPKIARARNNMVSGYQNAFKNQLGTNLVRPLSVAPMMSGVGYRPRGRSPLGVPPRAPAAHGTPIMRGGVMVRHNAPVLMTSNYPVGNNVKKVGHQPSISITPLPRQPAPQPTPQPAHNSKSTFVICEICDGYIKDLEQLRNHMQWIHKVKIHPKMIYNRPPLNCQKCQFRFFTDQGLERHLLGSHGLVTSSMQEAANKGKDAGRCPVCGRVYQWKLLNHVARDHNLTLKPAHLSYKCTVCTATFGMYKQFENHVYSAHSVVAKRVMDKSKPAAKPSDSLLKPLKINDEITIIPQPARSAAGSKDE